jgi:hypothetical protein
MIEEDPDPKFRRLKNIGIRIRIRIRIRNTAQNENDPDQTWSRMGTLEQRIIGDQRVTVAWKPVENSERMRLFSLMRRFCALMIFSSCLRLCCRRSWFSTHCPFPIPVHREEKVLKGQCPNPYSQPQKRLF